MDGYTWMDEGERYTRVCIYIYAQTARLKCVAAFCRCYNSRTHIRIRRVDNIYTYNQIHSRTTSTHARDRSVLGDTFTHTRARAD